MNTHTQISPTELHATIKLGIDAAWLLQEFPLSIPSAPFPPEARGRKGFGGYGGGRAGYYGGYQQPCPAPGQLAIGRQLPPAITARGDATIPGPLPPETETEELAAFLLAHWPAPKQTALRIAVGSGDCVRVALARLESWLDSRS